MGQLFHDITTWIGHLDPSWVAVIGVVIGGSIAGRYAKRGARIAADTADRVAALQTEVAADSTLVQQESAARASRVQLITTRESHRIQNLDAAYLGLLEHLQRWNHWVHDVNRYNYAQHDWQDESLNPFTHSKSEDDPRDPRDLNNPDPRDVARPPVDPPDLRPDSRTDARLVAYASTEVRELFGEWTHAARVAADTGRCITGSTRALEWQKLHPEIIKAAKLRFQSNVTEFDEKREAVEARIRSELKSTFRFDAEDPPGG